jgi:AcrR family transcriptional regulator
VARTAKVEDRREQIVRAAMRVFARKGFDRATNKDIAREAGITPGLIYHYFKSKEDLLRAAIEGYPARQLLRSLPTEMLELPPEALLRGIAMRILEVGEDEDIVRFLRIFLPQAIHHPELSSPGSSTAQELVRFLDQALTAKMESGELKCANAGLVAQLFIGTLLDLVLRRQILQDPALLKYKETDIVDTLVATTLEGLLPR